MLQCSGTLSMTSIASSSHVPCATDTQAYPALSTSQTPRDDAKASLENPCFYSSLPKLDSIRFLSLIPYEDENGPIQCRLYDYPLQKSGEGTHLYEALSYVWGGWDKPHCISIDGCNVYVTANLYAALICLRDLHTERIMWVDAICIYCNGHQTECRGN